MGRSERLLPFFCFDMIKRLCVWVGVLGGAAALGQAPAPPPAIETGTLPAVWITGGPNCLEVPDWQIHEYNANFYILRESGCTNYEKPFLYLIFGRGRCWWTRARAPRWTPPRWSKS